MECRLVRWALSYVIYCDIRVVIVIGFHSGDKKLTSLILTVKMVINILLQFLKALLAIFQALIFKLLPSSVIPFDESNGEAFKFLKSH